MGVEIALRELFVLDTDVDDTGRLCPAKKWGLTSNDETIEATDVVFGKGKKMNPHSRGYRERVSLKKSGLSAMLL